MSAPNSSTAPTFHLKPIPSVSPSLAEVLRRCALQAALSRVTGLRQYVLSNPKAWLGTAYHSVFERLGTPTDEDLTDLQFVEQLWSNAIESLRRKALAHPLDRRFAGPVKWPNYYLVHASVSIRAQQALAEQPRRAVSAEIPELTLRVVREERFTAMAGKLVGRPDVISDDEIRDYKSGSLYEQTSDGIQVVKEAYVRQLRLYGHLVKEKYGHCPLKGKLLPMLGEAVEIDLDPETCAAEAGEAVKLLDEYNAKLATVPNVVDLAAPSSGACRWCEFNPHFPDELHKPEAVRYSSAA